MILDYRVKPVLESIEFVSRYRTLSDKYRVVDKKMSSYSTDKVMSILNDFGYRARYNKKESFFSIKLEEEELITQLNIVLRYGLVELILSVVRDGERYTVGGPFGLIARLLGEEGIKPPAFSSYGDLKYILGEGVAILNDLRAGLLKND